MGVVTHYFNPSRRETGSWIFEFESSLVYVGPCVKKKVYKCVLFISEEHSAVPLRRLAV